MSGSDCYLGIDVGTGSARAGLFSATGVRIAHASRSIQSWRDGMTGVEQSSADIWRAICDAVREAMAQSKVTAGNVRGIGFDATCSLVAVDERGKPVSVSSSGVDERNVIVWMDQRATREADEINQTAHPVLKYVGGVISPEMQTPKLLWLKRHLPACWSRAAHFFDLPDYLTFRATGSTARSLCSTVCKWTYLGHEGEGGRWDPTYFRQAGLGDLADEGFARIGTRVIPSGSSVAGGLTDQAASELGLEPGTPVGASIIDAHAGGLGSLGAALGAGFAMGSAFALVAGTSCCHMAVSTSPVFVPGVWGPYFSAMVPGLWLSEGGQSAAGAAIDRLVLPAAKTFYNTTSSAEAYSHLSEAVSADVVQRTRSLHVCPDIVGNRSPKADPSMRGAVIGLTADEELSALYLATLQSLAYGTRAIVEAMNDAGHRLTSMVACGGLAQNELYLRQHADATGLTVVVPAETESVLLGSAVLGAVAAGAYADVASAMQAMSRPGRVIEPDASTRKFHDAKCAVYQRLQNDQVAYRKIMATVGT